MRSTGSLATSHSSNIRMWRRVVLVAVIVVLITASVGILPIDLIPTTPPPTTTSRLVVGGNQQTDLAETTDDHGGSITSFASTSTNDIGQQQQRANNNEDDDSEDDHGDWLWDTTASNPRLHSPTFIPGNVRHLLLTSPLITGAAPSTQQSQKGENFTPSSLTVEDFQRSVNNIRQCREISSGGGGVKVSPFVQSLGKHLYLQYTEDLHRQSKTSPDGDDSKQQHTTSNRPRIMYNCESNRMGRFCGGMGDRFRGMITTFYLSLLSNRRFELFHPVPLPLQRYLRPHLLNWIPTPTTSTTKSNTGTKSGNNNDDDSSNSAFTNLLHELDTDSTISIPDSAMMSIKGHSTFLRKLEKRTKDDAGGRTSADAGSVVGASKNGNDFRIQTNSIGVDGFITPAKTPTLWSRRQDIFGVPTTPNGGGLDSSKVNISTYFGCLYEVMFQPAPALLNSAATALGPHIATIAKDQQQRGDVVTNKGVMEGRTTGKVVVHSAVVVPQSSHNTPTYKKAASNQRVRLHLHTPYIGMQVRMGGSWAAGMVVKEPFRTSPEAVDDFFSVVQDVRSASNSIVPPSIRGGTADGSSPSTAMWPVFVSSDSERFIEETKKKFGVDVVRFVQGGFQHTDTLNFQEAKQRAKQSTNSTQAQQLLKPVDAENDKLRKQLVRRQEYLSTLTNHYLLGLSNHVIMAQSGFGDTAYWRSRREASCIFVNMKNLKTAWQHHLSYYYQGVGRGQGGASSSEGGGSGGEASKRLKNLAQSMRNSNPEWYPSSQQQSSSSSSSQSTTITVASSRCNRIFDVSQQQSTFYSEKCPTL